MQDQNSKKCDKLYRFHGLLKMSRLRTISPLDKPRAICYIIIWH